MEFDGARIDGILWHRDGYEYNPLCPKHYMRMSLVDNNYNESHLRCEECERVYVVPREYEEERGYIRHKLEAIELRKLKYINIDGEYVPIAEDKADSPDGKYFVKAILTDSKVGQRLVVYAGEKGKKQKTEIFVEPDIKRLSFDQTDTHPSEVFIKLEATFKDGSTASIKKTK